MKAAAALLRLARACWPRSVTPPTPPGPLEDIVITNTPQIRRALLEVARQRRPVALQAADGQFVAHAQLDTSNSQHLMLRLNGPVLSPTTPLQWPLNATVSSVDGMALLTLHRGAVGAEGVLRAGWPDQLIQVQSRRHFRLTGLGGARSRAWLSRPDSEVRHRLHDLSEDGVGVELASHDWLRNGDLGAAALHLDDEVIPLPLLQVVHSRVGASGTPGLLGARLLGISAEHARALRRWIVAVQAEGLNVSSNQA